MTQKQLKRDSHERTERTRLEDLWHCDLDFSDPVAKVSWMDELFARSRARPSLSEQRHHHRRREPERASARLLQRRLYGHHGLHTR